MGSMKTKAKGLLLLAVVTGLVIGCGRSEPEEPAEESQDLTITTPAQTEQTSEAESDTEPPDTDTKGPNGKWVVIDAGHQEKGNADTEPVGPGSPQMKAKVSSGTAGVSTGLAEYELNLEVALKLKSELRSRGYQVIMVRESNQVDISNAERAAMANQAQADVFIRIHADGSENPSERGIMTICQTAANPYNAQLHDESYALSEAVLDCMVEETGASRRKVWETDTMSGINWAEVPTTIVEMGFMTNPEEDELLASDAYQDQLVTGMANGIDQFLFGMAEAD